MMLRVVLRVCNQPWVVLWSQYDSTSRIGWLSHSKVQGWVESALVETAVRKLKSWHDKSESEMTPQPCLEVKRRFGPEAD